MKRVTVTFVCLLVISTFFISGKVFAQEDAIDKQESIEAMEGSGSIGTTEVTEATEATEPTEATIPYSDAYNSPDTGADPVDVDEDAE